MRGRFSPGVVGGVAPVWVFCLSRTVGPQRIDGLPNPFIGRSGELLLLLQIGGNAAGGHCEEYPFAKFHAPQSRPAAGAARRQIIQNLPRRVTQ